MAKTYNPFKMWGAWFGAVSGFTLIGLVILYFFITDIDTLRNANPPLTGICSNISGFFSGLGCVMFFFFLSIFIILFVGFLLGWGIHSLFRYFWRFK